MSAEDVLRSFAQAGEPDEAVIRDGLTYGTARALLAQLDGARMLLERAESLACLAGSTVGIGKSLWLTAHHRQAPKPAPVELEPEPWGRP